MDNTKFLGIDCIEASFGEIKILAAKSVGPRIISFSFRESGNIFAELPGQFLDHPEGSKFFFYGGHRLWIAPEIPLVTYLPDNKPVKINKGPRFIELIEEGTIQSRIRKSIKILESEFPNILIVDHQLKNESDSPATIAPWSITQFKLGGKAILPFKAVDAEKNPYIPDRSLFLWPYTDIQDARIHSNKEFIFVTPNPENENPMKIGVGHYQQWLAYFINGYLFIKYSSKDGLDCKLDLGAAGQCYCNNKFLELETLGKYFDLLPDKVIGHREVWRIIEKPFDSLSTNNMLDFMNKDKQTDYCQGLLK